METLVRQLNDVLCAYKEKNDYFQKMKLEFSVREDGQLCLNGLSLGIDKPMELIYADFADSELIQFEFKGHEKIEIQMRWPQDDSPALHTVAYTNAAGDVPVFYCA